MNLILHNCLRHMPNKRKVYDGVWNNKPIVAKIFFGKNKKRNFDKELAGYASLISRKITTPICLYAGLDQNTKNYILIFEKIEQRKINLNLILNTLSILHSHGIIQTDCHENNFLYNGEKVYVLDPADIIVNKSGHKISANKIKHNLALLLSQYPPDQWPPESNRSLINKYRKVGQKKYLSKMMRACTVNKVYKKNNHIGLYKKKHSLEILFNNIENYFNPEADYLKQGGSSTVIKIKYDDLDLIIKRYNIKSKWHFVRRCFRPTRASRSWISAHKLLSNNILTPEPIGYLNKKIGLLNAESYYISLAIDGINIKNYLEKIDNDIILKTKKLLTQLYQSKIYHGDLKASNILVSNNNIYLIDLDATKWDLTNFEKYHQRDINRFMQNWDGANRELLEKHCLDFSRMR